MRALDDTVRAGKVRYVGCSNLAAWQMLKANGLASQHGWSRFESLQAYYTIAGRDLEREIVPALADQQMGLMVWCTSARVTQVVVASIAALAGCAAAPQQTRSLAAETDVQQVIASPLRSDQDRRMDNARRPADFLHFTQVAPGMQVLDVSAGGGYTSQLLALAVGPQGRVWAQSPRPGTTLTQRVTEHPQANLVVTARPFEDPLPEDAPKLDLITIVLNYHDITFLPVDRAKMNQRLFAALKPGGRLVVVDRSARTGADIGVAKTLHRIDEAIVRAELRQAGFVLDAEGDFLRNPADLRDDSSGDPKVPTDKFALRFVRR